MPQTLAMEEGCGYMFSTSNSTHLTWSSARHVACLWSFLATVWNYIYFTLIHLGKPLCVSVIMLTLTSPKPQIKMYSIILKRIILCYTLNVVRFWIIPPITVLLALKCHYRSKVSFTAPSWKNYLITLRTFLLQLHYVLYLPWSPMHYLRTNQGFSVFHLHSMFLSLQRSVT